MLYARQVVKIFLLIFILALVASPLISQDTNKSDDNSSQSGNPGDQQNDQVATLNDFLFENTAGLQEVCLNDMTVALPSSSSDVSSSVCFPEITSFLPHIFISECGLMPRAPARA